MTARRIILLVTTVVAGFSMATPGAEAAFGLNEVNVIFNEADGSPARRAGSHPYAMSTSFRFNTRIDAELGDIPDEEPKKLHFDLPDGLAGNPTAVPRCPATVFPISDSSGFNECPDDTVVGVARLSVGAASEAGKAAPVYNVVPSPGVTARIGFLVERVPITIDLGVNGEAPNNITADIVNIPQGAVGIYAAGLEIWGDPADPTHDQFRGRCLRVLPGPNGELVSKGICEGGREGKPFLTLPTSCQDPLTTSYGAVSWQKPEADPVSGVTQSSIMTGCAELGFGPTVAAGGTAQTGEAPSGLNFDLDVVNPGLTEPTGRADSDVERAVVTLPPGFTTNPSVAGGLQACSFAEYRSETVDSDPGTGCPEASKIGTVEIESPLLEKGEGGEGLQVLDGSLFVAKQHDNPFDNLLTIYMVIKDPTLGLLIKRAGRVEPNPVTGQLTTTFEGLPQLPFSHFHLHFREGQRAPLITPATCGPRDVEADLYPYAEGVVPVHDTATLSVSSACASSPAAQPNTVGFSAGTTNAQAGRYSPFVLNLGRPDGSQQLSKVGATLPGGLLGKLAGIPYCPESGIAQAASRGGEGEGAKELAQPSCPASSQVGTVIATAGAGAEPLTVTGKAYLAGPYKGAPLSLEIITPAIAGPFDLGVVAVRTALQVDPFTAQITAESDSIPTILHGLPLDLRSISIDMDRQGFTLNPTSCEPKSITGAAISTLGGVASLSQYFQASECGKLRFKPTLNLSLKGATRRAGHPALRALLTYPKRAGYSNIARAQVGLPHSEFLDQSSIGKACTKPVLLAQACPAKSVYGKAKAWSPLLEKPLEGKLYLVGGFGYKLPALVADLSGQIRVLLVGKIDTDKAGGIRSTFEVVPDAPVEKFELTLKGGPKHGLLENSENICKKKQVAGTYFGAQNGRTLQLSTTIANGCGKKQKGRRASARPKKHRSG
jgi:hypothetical protein